MFLLNHRISLTGFCLLSVLSFNGWSATEEEESVPIIETEFDPYYSNIAAIWPLTAEEIPTVELKNERKIYLDLLTNIFSPRFLLVEASINPLPVLGVYTKNNHRGFYDSADVGDDLNLIQALTEGFEEPYAVSFFIGNVLRFKTPQGTEESINKGYSGLLLSVGDQHIKDSELFDDNWYEMEWKLKGDKRTEEEYWSWSFRVGTKMHSHTDIADVNYVGIRREVFPNKPGETTFWHNLGIDFRMDFQRATRDLVQRQVFVERRWPGNKRNFSLGIGLLKQDGKYSGALANTSGSSDTSLIIRPGLSF